jgi:hypothetical protein
MSAGPRRDPRDLRELADSFDLNLRPATGRADLGSTTMFGQIQEDLARQRYREAHLEARRIRLVRAARAERRARRAVEIATRAAERAEVLALAVTPVR